MYNYISGQLDEATPSYAVIDCNGVGYLLEISLNTYSQIKDLTHVKLLVHFVVREDAQILYGFYEESERQLFRQLITVSGVGAGTARVMLSSLTVEEIREAIATQNAKVIQSVKGIGAKTAQRIIIDLHDKLDKIAPSTLMSLAADNKNSEEALTALVMLGFSKADAGKALQKISKQSPDLSVEEFIKQALKIL